MKIALIGASGNVGSRLLKEFSDRGHAITAIARQPERITGLPGATPIAGDASAPDALAETLRGHDAVVSALPFAPTDARALIDAVRASGVTRLLVVGGAGSLEVAPGQRLIDQPGFPAEYKAEASAGVAFLDALRQADDLEWTFLSPSAMFVAGERTGVFRLGTDTLLSNEQGSSISYEDYAIALADEIAQPRHIRQRFTVGY